MYYLIPLFRRKDHLFSDFILSKAEHFRAPWSLGLMPSLEGNQGTWHTFRHVALQEKKAQMQMEVKLLIKILSLWTRIDQSFNRSILD